MQTGRCSLQSLVCFLQVFLIRASKFQTLMGKKLLRVSCSHHFDTTYHYPAVNLTSEQHRTLKEKHYSSSDKSIVHRNVDDKQKIIFLILEHERGHRFGCEFRAHCQTDSIPAPPHLSQAENVWFASSIGESQ